MIEETICLFILEENDSDLIHIKQQAKKFAPNAVFVNVKDRSEFDEKLNWVIPDIFISDYNLIDINGFEALQEVRSKFPYIPFILITEFNDLEEKLAEALFYGANGYLFKDKLECLPHLLEKIYTRSQIAIKKHKRREQLIKQNNILIQKLSVLFEKSNPCEELNHIRKSLEDLENNFRELTM